MTVAVDVVVLAYGQEPLLGECVASILAADHLTGKVVVVDNGAAAAVDALPADPRIVLVRPRTNTGYAGGCNLGAAAGTSEMVVFVNSDVLVEPDALTALATRLSDPMVGLATGCLLLLEDRHLREGASRDAARVNTAGNPVHWSGFSWCGGFGEARAGHLASGPVASISGGLFAVRRTVWESLGGFEETYFAYHEDVDLSLRCWLSGLRVVYEPGAVGWHDYAFSRNPHKSYLVERNRLLTWLTVPSTSTWVRMAVPFAVVQAMALTRSVLNGDGWAWLRASAWAVRHLPWIRARRRDVQRRRRLPDDVWLSLTHARLSPPDATGVAVPSWVNAVLAALSGLVVPRRTVSWSA